MMTNKKDLKYTGFNYDYDTYRDCAAYGCDMICRCSTIQDLQVTYFDANQAEEFAKKFELTDLIDIYCLERYLNIKIKKNEIDFDFNIVNGYYGEELDSFYMEQDSINKLEIYVDFLKAEKNLTKKINQLLVLEYDFLLPRLENKSVSIQTIKINNIQLNNVGRSKNVDTGLYYLPLNIGLPLCVCVLEQGKYNLIDGYTRVMTYKKQHNLGVKSKKTIKAIIYS